MTTGLIEEFNLNESLITALLETPPSLSDDSQAARAHSALNAMQANINFLDFARLERGTPDLEAKIRGLRVRLAEAKRLVAGRFAAEPQRVGGTIDRELVLDKYAQIDGLMGVNRNVVETNAIALDVAGQLDQDMKRFAESQGAIKLINTELKVSNQTIKKVYRQKIKADVLFYVGVGLPLLLVVMLVVMRIHHFIKK